MLVYNEKYCLAIDTCTIIIIALINWENFPVKYGMYSFKLKKNK